MGRTTMPELADVLKFLGFATPVLYAGATYRFFHWLDRKASGPAKKAISGWLEPREYDGAAVAAAILEVFDRIYSQPLEARQAFFRSASISTAVWVVSIYEFALQPLHITWLHSKLLFLVLFCSVIMSDYIALFLIRHFLVNNIFTPVKATLIAPLLGIVMVLIGYFLGFIVSAITYTLFSLPLSILDINWVITGDYTLEAIEANRYVGIISLLTGLVVHLWLPFFALCVGLLKGLNYILLATKRVQWFIKRGKDHPFDALGFVGAALVFFGAVAVQMLVSK
jgi:hypothetical protein